MTNRAMTPSQRAEYVRLSIATLDTLKAYEAAHRAPTLSPERRDRVACGPGGLDHEPPDEAGGPGDGDPHPGPGSVSRSGTGPSPA